MYLYKMYNNSINLNDRLRWYIGGIVKMIYGYCRISTAKQSIERQERNIKEYCNTAVILKEQYTGTEDDRPVFTKLMKNVRPGDSIIFDSVSRMSRTAEGGFKMYKVLFDMNVDLVFLKEPHINTCTYRTAISNSINKTGNLIADVYIEATNKVLMMLAEEQIHLAFEQAEKEVQDLRQRTREGIVTAKLNGKIVGRKTGAKIITKKCKECKQKIVRYSKKFNGSLGDADVIKLLNISRNTFYKYCRELKSEI